jgi:RHS repeat-associated protein
MTVAGQATVSYSYDSANRLTSIAQGSQTVAFGYDNANRRTQVALPNNVTANYTYDATGELTNITYTTGATTLGTLTYLYDAVGRRTGIGGSLGRSDLPVAVMSTSYNPSNQVAQWGSASLSYDLNGNLISDGTSSYAWNERDQLVQIVQGSTTAATYQYDPFGRRRLKTVNATTTRFLYDGDNFIQEQDGSGAVTANVLIGLGSDEVYSRTQGSNTSEFLIDHFSVIAEADSAGVIQTTYSYDPYGKTTQTGALSTNGQRYTGREQDTAGLYYYRARYYSTSLNRFISEDPVGIDGGINFYRYAGDDPIDFDDPTGLAPIGTCPPDPAKPCIIYPNPIPRKGHPTRCSDCTWDLRVCLAGGSTFIGGMYAIFKCQPCLLGIGLLQQCCANTLEACLKTCVNSNESYRWTPVPQPN